MTEQMLPDASPRSPDRAPATPPPALLPPQPPLLSSLLISARPSGPASGHTEVVTPVLEGMCNGASQRRTVGRVLSKSTRVTM